MKCDALAIADVLLLTPKQHRDPRGTFTEVYHQTRYHALGLPQFVQHNRFSSQKNVLRGLHFQQHHPQAKLISVLVGEIFEVAVDLRHGSETFGQSVSVELSATGAQQLFIPAGFAHGILALTEIAEVIYQCSDYYQPQDESGLRFDEPLLKIDWPVKKPILSAKDQQWDHCDQQLPSINVEGVL